MDAALAPPPDPQAIKEFASDSFWSDSKPRPSPSASGRNSKSKGGSASKHPRSTPPSKSNPVDAAHAEEAEHEADAVLDPWDDSAIRHPGHVAGSLAQLHALPASSCHICACATV